MFQAKRRQNSDNLAMVDEMRLYGTDFAGNELSTCKGIKQGVT
jgi:hypothetical protein